ncbi:glycoside hydrolase family 3 C-terminal domain-containing protein, partial [Cohnella sp. GbtcB17]|uniref:glycoside hydrolase family 3 C-terminal domain-containing protein n=1 Tax=Cohnella sp. GbtcB17 TaxID=2824762 RepID=UPI0020C73DAA
MRARFEQSAVRLLKNMFRLGLFENPYLNPGESAALVGNLAFMEAGFRAQLRSVVMLKNEGALPLPKRKTVYIPKRKLPADTDWMGNPVPASETYPMNLDIVRKYFDVTDRPADADFALVCTESPRSTKGSSKADAEAGGNGYIPISLQYRPYTAKQARETSLAGDPRDVLNRSYKGKTAAVANEGDLDVVLEPKRLMTGKPDVVSIALSKPAVAAEFEPSADGILAHFAWQVQAILGILSGAFVPQALLTFQIPADI